MFCSVSIDLLASLNSPATPSQSEPQPMPANGHYGTLPKPPGLFLVF